MDLDASPDALSPLAWLVGLAVESDDSSRLIAAAGSQLGRPLALVAATGEPLGHAPDGTRGRRALAVAAAAARTPVVAPPGWRVVPLMHGGARLAVLAVADDGDDGDGSGGALLQLIATLLREQVTRATLVRGQTASFVRRLVRPPGMRAERARREGAVIGVAVAEAYWPAVLTWSSAARCAEVAEGVFREAGGPAGAGLTATVDEHLVLLHPVDQGGGDPVECFEQLVARVRVGAPASSVQAIAAEDAVPLGDLSDAVARLVRLCVLPPRAEASELVVRAGQYALDHLLWGNVDALQAHDFVEERLGRLIAWDREHRSDLLRVLEAALDFPRHDRAASRCFMHRNTFRHRLRQATDVLGADIEDPDIRLAVHVALKLRRRLAAPASADRAGRPAAVAG